MALMTIFKDDKGIFLSELIPRFVVVDKRNVSRKLETHIKMVKIMGI